MTRVQTRNTVACKREKDRLRYNNKRKDPEFRNQENKRFRLKRKIDRQIQKTIQQKVSTYDLINAANTIEIKELRKKNKQLQERIAQLEEEKRLLEQQLDVEKNRQLFVFPTLPHHEEVITHALSDPVRLRQLIKITKEEFQQMQEEILFEMHRRNSIGQVYSYQVSRRSAISIRAHLFITLFWLKHYPTDAVMSHFFRLDARTITRILKKTLICIIETYNRLIRWPTDDEANTLRQKFSQFTHGPFQDVICVADGTEIRVLRPSNNEQQRRVYSKKKKQHSLNVMVLCLLNGVLIFVSNPRIGAHDQSHWNELGLRDKFIGKNYGILGDGGFTFNRQQDAVQIKGFKPFKKKKNSDLTAEQKKFNQQLSELRVVVENSIAKLKSWRILKGTYHHFSLAGEDQIEIDHVIQACALLTQQQLIKSPLRSDNWRPKSHPLNNRMLIANLIN